MKLRKMLDRGLGVIRYGAPKRLRDNASWARDNPGSWTRVFPREESRRRPPIKFGEIDAHFESLYPPFMPEMGVLTLDRGRLLGPYGWLVASDGSLLYENSWYGSDFPSRAWTIPYGRRRRVKGVCLSLASEFAAGNYGHFVQDCLSRAALFLKAGHSFSEVDHVYIPKPLSRSADAMLRRIGVMPEKCIWAGAGCIEADVVLGTTFPGTKRNYPAWAMEFFRGLLDQDLTSPHRRIYISRAGTTRQVRNEPELRDILDRHGFEIYDFKKVEDEARYFAEAAIVVGAHGAGLTNLVFLSPQAKVLELLPSDHIWPYYYTITESAGAEYAYIVGQSLGSRPKGTWGPSPFDFIVDPSSFEQALATLCKEPVALRAPVHSPQ
jgi:hypothetical protein